MSKTVAGNAAKAGMSLALALSLAASPLATNAFAQTPENNPESSNVESESIEINESIFPDANFRAWLLNPANIGGKGADGILSKEEIESITSISVRWCGIKSLAGIENFVNLTHLNAERNELVEIDLAPFPKLKTAFLRTNNLVSVTTGESNSELELLDVFDNHLTSFDASHLTGLKQLVAASNKLTSLDLSACTKLATDGVTVNNNENIKTLVLPNAGNATVRTELLTSQEAIDGYAKMTWHVGSANGELLSGETVRLDGSTLFTNRIANPYTITFSLDAPDATGLPSPIQTTWGTEVALPGSDSISRPGYSFAGWILPNGSLANAGQQVSNLAGRQDYSKTALVKAKWTPNSYTVTFEGESNDASLNARYGVPFVLPSCEQRKEGYVFAGWTLPDGSLKKPGQSVSNLTTQNGDTVAIKPCWVVDKLSELKNSLVEQTESLARSKMSDDFYESTKKAVNDLATAAKSAIETAQSTQEATERFMEFSDEIAKAPTKTEIDEQALALLSERTLPSSFDDVTIDNCNEAAAIASEWSDGRAPFAEIAASIKPFNAALSSEEASEVASRLEASESARNELSAAKGLLTATNFIAEKTLLISRTTASVRSSDLIEFESAQNEAEKTGLSLGMLKSVSSDLSAKAELARCKRSSIASIEQELRLLEAFGPEYSAESKAQLQSIAQNGIDGIESAADVRSVRKELEDTSKAIRSVPDVESEKAELEQSRRAAIEALESALSSYLVTDYETDAWAEIENAARLGKAAIESAADKEQIESALATALEKMASVEKKPAAGNGAGGGSASGGGSAGDAPEAEEDDEGALQPDSGQEGDPDGSPFLDVDPQAWYATSVEKARSLGYIKGSSPDSFAPEDKISRADVAVIISRMAGVEGSLSEGPLPFDDVDAKSYFGPAVSWASSLGIAKGFDGTASFAPMQKITREDFAVMLWRYASAAEMDAHASNITEALSRHPDSSQASPHAIEALAWAIERGYIGQSDVLRPRDAISRAEAATVAVRMQPDGALDSLS